jgi:hypothetical protein
MLPDLCSLKKQIENENHESAQIFHAQCHFMLVILINTLRYSHMAMKAHECTSVPLTSVIHFFCKALSWWHQACFCSNFSLIFHHFAKLILYVTSVLSATSHEHEPLLSERVHISYDMYWILAKQGYIFLLCHDVINRFYISQNRSVVHDVFVMLLLPLNNMKDLWAVFV